MSSDGQHGLTIIAFIGSVFSPYYAWSGRERPENHCAINVALYGRGGARWTMTERGHQDLHRNRQTLSIGPSGMHWSGSALEMDLCEFAAPFPTKVVGRVRVIPEVVTNRHFVLDAEGRHAWWPIAPRARVEVDFDRPSLKWKGTGYLDTNAGDEPLEDGFESWDWSRANVRDNAAVLYDVRRRDGSALTLGLRFDKSGGVDEVEPPKRQALPASPIWRVERRTHADAGTASVSRTLEDSPFYARSVLNTTLFGERTEAMHESLALNRFSSQWVKCLLPFRMPRWTQ